MWALADFLGLLEGDSKAKRLPWSGLPVTRGTNQGRLVSSTLFNVVVDKFVRTWMVMTVEDHRVSQDVLVDTVGRCVVFFYADNGIAEFTPLGMAAACNERPGRTFLKVWPGGQRCKVTHNNLPSQSSMGRDFGGGHGA